MNEDQFNISLRKLLKSFGVTAQREVEKAVAAALAAGKLSGTETLPARASLRVDGLEEEITVEGKITLGSG